MDTNTRLKRLNYLKQKHKNQHSIVEALEAEKAPDDSISAAKRVKLSIKDEIFSIETLLKAEGIKY